MDNKINNILKDKLDIIVATCVIGIVLMIIIPLPPGILDLLIAFNITLSAIIFVATMFTTSVLDLSVFPTLLLITTLLRLGLNISSTRLILGTGEAGTIIEAFGNFVINNNYVVGIIIFLIIIVIQFVVITSGASRVSEVSARFTLDAMPGKQMSIDADLNAGIIDEMTAKKRRLDTQREADFFGAMDGASKFVKGDAIAGIVITLINIIGGIIIGSLQFGMTIGESAELFTRLTIGDGLVSQIPALLISTASGILVTRSNSEENFGKVISKQLSAFPMATGVAALIMFVLFLIPNMPKIPFLIAAITMTILTYSLYKEENIKKIEDLKSETSPAVQASEPENVTNLISVEAMELEVGYALIPLVDESKGGDLLQRIASIRRQCAIDMGIIIQPIRIRDNLLLKPNEYNIKMFGSVVAQGELMPNLLLCIASSSDPIDIKGIKTLEPTFNLPAVWIGNEKTQEAEAKGLTVVDATTVLVTHLNETIKTYSHELLGRQEVKTMLDNINEKCSVVIQELIPDQLGIGDVQKVLQNLLKERVPIKNMVTILETLADHSKATRDLEILTEYVRSSLGRTICKDLTNNNSIKVLALSNKLEEVIASNVQKTYAGSFPIIDPEKTQTILSNVKEKIDSTFFNNNSPTILVSPNIRVAFRRFIELAFPQINIISVNEIPNNIEINIEGVVDIQ